LHLYLLINILNCSAVNIHRRIVLILGYRFRRSDLHRTGSSKAHGKIIVGHHYCRHLQKTEKDAGQAGDLTYVIIHALIICVILFFFAIHLPSCEEHIFYRKTNLTYLKHCTLCRLAYVHYNITVCHDDKQFLEYLKQFVCRIIAYIYYIPIVKEAKPKEWKRLKRRKKWIKNPPGYYY